MSVTGNPPPLWRSRQERDSPPEARLLDEFPGLAERLAQGPDRRSVLQFMGAAMALGGMTACSPPEETILPYIDQPEGLIPGNPQFYATTLPCDGFGIGALVESHEGRPTKVEGNPDHPASLGATDAVMQAACLDLFDPARSRAPQRAGQTSSMAHVDALLSQIAQQMQREGGRGVAILGGASTSPSLQARLDALRTAFPGLRLYRHAPLGSGFVAACGQSVLLRPNLAEARVILSLDADLLGEGPGKLAHARAFAATRRRAGAGRDPARMSRLYAGETTPTLTGAAADHRWAVKPSEAGAVLTALAARLAGQGAPEAPVPAALLDGLADDLRRAGEAALVLPGPHLPPELQELALTLNQRLGSLGRTLDLLPQAPFMAGDTGDLADLVADLDSGGIDALLILQSNPAYTAPGDLDMRAALGKATLSVHLGTHLDETAALCDWHIPAAHVLESWGDARAFDGTASIIQPLIRPLYDGRTPAQVLAALAGEVRTSPRDLVMRHWTDQGLSPADWQQALQRGVIAGTEIAPIAPQCRALPQALDAVPQAPAPTWLELRFVPDPFLRDGSLATNVWLQELPRPLTKIVWGNVAAMAPATAHRLGLASGRVVLLRRAGHEISIPVWVQPGHPADTITLTLGHGRPVGEDGTPRGTDVYRLRTSDAPWSAAGVELTPLDMQTDIITTQHHHAMEGRDLVRHASLTEWLDAPEAVHAGRPAPPEQSLYPDWQYKDEAWGMVIDQTTCIGCNACVAACQAENNIPTVGPEECARGHEMHWLRVDRYHAGPEDDPRTYFQPVPCMHCEKAPCELVCPVNATVHTHDGLNAQVYNRCIGTRYCSQNCPYKVRRFNFHLYQPFPQGTAAPSAPVMNPDVSVRSRGVMEKCTYCVQRIQAARIDADIDRRPIADGEVVTACQQACPTQAIRFGNLNDPASDVRHLRDDPLNYALLGHLNTRPRTTYLARIENPNPALPDQPEAEDPDD